MNIKKIPLNENFINYKIAHRGLHSETVCENSMKAYELAIEHNFAIEIDVHLLNDGELAVVHDSNLKRVTGKEVIVERLSSEQLKEYPLWDGQVIPLFKDVLNLINGRVPLLVELKFDQKFDSNQAEAVLKQLENYDYPEMIALQSFHPYAVKFLKEHTDKYSVGFLSTFKLSNLSAIKNYILKSLMLYNKIHSDFISYDVTCLPNKYVDKKRKNGEQLLAWTINSKEKIEKAKTVADNFIFEKVDLSLL